MPVTRIAVSHASASAAAVPESSSWNQGRADASHASAASRAGDDDTRWTSIWYRDRASESWASVAREGRIWLRSRVSASR